MDGGVLRADGCAGVVEEISGGYQDTRRRNSTAHGWPTPDRLLIRNISRHRPWWSCATAQEPEVSSSALDCVAFWTPRGQIPFLGKGFLDVFTARADRSEAGHHRPSLRGGQPSHVCVDVRGCDDRPPGSHRRWSQNRNTSHDLAGSRRSPREVE